jgi:hypothetical protein
MLSAWLEPRDWCRPRNPGAGGAMLSASLEPRDWRRLEPGGRRSDAERVARALGLAERC